MRATSIPATWSIICSHSSSKGVKAPVSKDRRLIVVYTGNKTNFVKNGLLLFPSGTRSGNYHDNINWCNFKKWVTTHLLPNLPPHFILIVDNAFYQNTKELQDPIAIKNKIY